MCIKVFKIYIFYERFLMNIKNLMMAILMMSTVLTPFVVQAGDKGELKLGTTILVGLAAAPYLVAGGFVLVGGGIVGGGLLGGTVAGMIKGGFLAGFGGMVTGGVVGGVGTIATLYAFINRTDSSENNNKKNTN